MKHTNYMEPILFPKKLILPLMFKEFPAFHGTHRSPSLDPILSHMNVVDTIVFYLRPLYMPFLGFSVAKSALWENYIRFSDHPSHLSAEKIVLPYVSGYFNNLISHPSDVESLAITS